MIRSNVDLPDPDFPNKATISPSAKRKSTPSSTVRSLRSGVRKVFLTFFKSSSAIGAMVVVVMVAYPASLPINPIAAVRMR